MSQGLPAGGAQDRTPETEANNNQNAEQNQNVDLSAFATKTEVEEAVTNATAGLSTKMDNLLKIISSKDSKISGLLNENQQLEDNVDQGSAQVNELTNAVSQAQVQLKAYADRDQKELDALVTRIPEDKKGLVPKELSVTQQLDFIKGNVATLFPGEQTFGQPQATTTQGEAAADATPGPGANLQNAFNSSPEQLQAMKDQALSKVGSSQV